MKKLISLDWLTLNYRVSRSLEELKIGSIRLNILSGFKYEYCEGTGVFRTRVIMYDTEGEKLLTIVFEPYSNIIDKDLMQITISNKSFYNGNWVQLIRLVPYIHEGNWIGISRIDIACDWRAEFGDIDGRNLAHDILTERAFVDRYKECCSFYDIERGAHVDERHNIPRQISFGAKTSHIKWKLYNKTKEIEDESKKDYILCAWLEHGFVSTEGVWRLEVSISDVAKLQIQDANGENCLTIAKLADFFPAIFRQLCEERFRIFRKKRDNGGAWVERINIFDFTEGNLHCQTIKPESKPREDTPKTLVRQLVKSLEVPNIAFKIGFAQQVIQMIWATLSAFSLENWFVWEYGFSVEQLYDWAEENHLNDVVLSYKSWEKSNKK